MVYKEHGFNLHGFKINTITPGGTSKILNIPDGLVYSSDNYNRN